MSPIKRIIACKLLLLILTSYSALGQRQYPVAATNASAIVKRVLKNTPVIDGHNDLLIHYFDCKTCPLDLADYPINKQTKGHTDIERWRKGGVGGQLLNVFGGEQPPEALMNAYDLVHRMEIAYPADIRIVGTSTEMRAAMKQGRIAILPTLEGATRLKNSPSLLRSYYRLGLRSVTLAYKTNDLADGSDDEPRHNGVSESGKLMIREMNRLGVIIDISHVSEKAMNDVLTLSHAPVIFSHSNVRALADVNRNVSDATLLKLKSNRGIIMLTFVPYFTKLEHSKWLDAGDKLFYELERKYKGDRTKMDAEMDVWDKNNPQPTVTVADIADHFDHVKRLIGVDHIGIAGDFDGISFTIKGLEDVSTYPILFTELARRGWTEPELRKIAGQNFLRVFEDVEFKAKRLAKTLRPVLNLDN
jgi:membrane dipeptidase